MINDLMGIITHAGEKQAALVDRLKQNVCGHQSYRHRSTSYGPCFSWSLEKGCQDRFKLLTSGIKLGTNIWTLPLLKTKLRVWKIDNEIIKPTSRLSGEDETEISSANRGKT